MGGAPDLSRVSEAKEMRAGWSPDAIDLAGVDYFRITRNERDVKHQRGGDNETITALAKSSSVSSKNWNGRS
jgi:hypothetical protein